MSMLPPATVCADERLGPTDTGANAGAVQDITNAAAVFSLNSTWGTVSSRLAKQGAYFTFQARGADVYLRFVPDGATPGTTAGDASNGIKIPNGTIAEYWCAPLNPSVDVIGSGNGKLFIAQSSRNPGQV
jgi:hypothetical protein